MLDSLNDIPDFNWLIDSLSLKFDINKFNRDVCLAASEMAHVHIGNAYLFTLFDLADAAISAKLEGSTLEATTYRFINAMDSHYYLVIDGEYIELHDGDGLNDALDRAFLRGDYAPDEDESCQ